MKALDDFEREQALAIFARLHYPSITDRFSKPCIR